MKLTNFTKRLKRYSVIIWLMLIILIVSSYGISKTSDNAEQTKDSNIESEKLYSEEKPYCEQLIASWYDYSLGYENQKCILDREPCYSQRTDTCASRDYPRGSMLKVSYQKNNLDNSVICRVNDYGPEISTGRAIDLSSHAFQQLAPLDWGLITVTIQEIK